MGAIILRHTSFTGATKSHKEAIRLKGDVSCRRSWCSHTWIFQYDWFSCCCGAVAIGSNSQERVIKNRWQLSAAAGLVVLG